MLSMLRLAAASAALLTLAACAGKNTATADAASAPAVRILNASYYAITEDPALLDWTKATAGSLFAQHCASCHGADMKGKAGVPNLVDYDTLWGWGGAEETDEGNYTSLVQSITHGIRNQDCADTERKQQYGACPDTRYSSMVGFGALKVLTDAEVDDVVEHVLSLAGQPADARAAARGAKLYVKAGCAECHAADGYGVKPYGGPNLRDDVWLYGADKATIRDITYNGKVSACPPWRDRIDAAGIRALAAYLYGKSLEAF